jgi:hypothetical protein
MQWKVLGNLRQLAKCRPGANAYYVETEAITCKHDAERLNKIDHCRMSLAVYIATGFTAALYRNARRKEVLHRTSFATFKLTDSRFNLMIVFASPKTAQGKPRGGSIMSCPMVALKRADGSFSGVTR